MKALVYLLFFALLVLHQDFWWWDSETMVLGFMPIALAFHAAFSIACALLGVLAIKAIWPHDLEKLSDAPAESAPAFRAESGSDENSESKPEA